MTLIFAIAAVIFAVLVLAKIPEFLGLSWSALWALSLTLFLVYPTLPGTDNTLVIILVILVVILVIVAVGRGQKQG